MVISKTEEKFSRVNKEHWGKGEGDEMTVIYRMVKRVS